MCVCACVPVWTNHFRRDGGTVISGSRRGIGAAMHRRQPALCELAEVKIKYLTVEFCVLIIY